MAGVLAIGATLLSLLFCLSFLQSPLGASLMFGPGYAVTVGYYWRAFGNPSPAMARAIWGASLLVQGAWLSFVLWKAESNPLAAGWVPSLIVLWWGGSAVASLWGLVAEPDHSTAE